MQGYDARSSGEASSQQVCAYEYLLLVVVVMLAATHQAHSYVLGLLQSAGLFFVSYPQVESIPAPRVSSHTTTGIKHVMYTTAVRRSHNHRTKKH